MFGRSEGTAVLNAFLKAFYIGKNFAVITALKGFDLIEDRNTMFTRGLYA